MPVKNGTRSGWAFFNVNGFGTVTGDGVFEDENLENE